MNDLLKDNISSGMHIREKQKNWANVLDMWYLLWISLVFESEFVKSLRKFKAAGGGR